MLLSNRCASTSQEEMASSTKNQHLQCVKSQYMVRGNRNNFTPSSPRPEADGGETVDKRVQTRENVQQGLRKPQAKPAFFDSKNRNCTDLAFRQRQSQKDVQFVGNPHPKHESQCPGIVAKSCGCDLQEKNFNINFE